MSADAGTASAMKLMFCFLPFILSRSAIKEPFVFTFNTEPACLHSQELLDLFIATYTPYFIYLIFSFFEDCSFYFLYKINNLCLQKNTPTWSIYY